MDIRLHYIEKGSGPPLILLHGNGESADYFKHQLTAFSAHCRVLAPDTRGHGRSPRGTAPFKLRQFAEDLKDFMDSLGIVKADILGFSDGGNIALLFALKYPDRIGRLILNGANLFPTGMAPRYLLPVAISWCAYSVLAPFSQQARHKKALQALMLFEPHIRPRALGALHMPVLVVAGSRDMIRHRHTELIHRSLPDARCVILSGSHFVAAEKSGEFNAAVLEFLNESL
jgi:pimeloyl-ACP methyl ester carboxylesterase